MNIDIRHARGSDAAAYLDFIKTVGAETDNLSFGKEGISTTPERYAKVIDGVLASPNSAMLLATDGDTLVGYCGIYGENGRTAHRAEIALFIRRDHWRRGIGTALLNRAREEAITMGLHVLHLEVRSDNQNAIVLYQKCGYQKTGYSKDYLKINGKYFDIDCMELYL